MSACFVILGFFSEYHLNMEIICGKTKFSFFFISPTPPSLAGFKIRKYILLYDAGTFHFKNKIPWCSNTVIFFFS